MRKSDITIYPPYFDKYYFPILPDENILDILKWRTENFLQFYGQLPRESWDYSYAPSKWTIKQIVQHIIDSEQIFCYRALCMLRNDSRPLAGFEQDDYAAAAKIEHLSVEDMLNSLTIQAMYTYNFFKSLDETELKKQGVANDFPIQVGAYPLAIVGHDLHHRMIIETNYLPNLLS